MLTCQTLCMQFFHFGRSNFCFWVFILKSLFGSFHVFLSLANTKYLNNIDLSSSLYVIFPFRALKFFHFERNNFWIWIFILKFLFGSFHVFLSLANTKDLNNIDLSSSLYAIFPFRALQFFHFECNNFWIWIFILKFVFGLFHVFLSPGQHQVLKQY